MVILSRFVVLSISLTRKASLLQLNPFGKPDGLGTGTPLFDMRDESDRAVLFGDAPFEFRVMTDTGVAAGTKAKVGQNLLKDLDEPMKQRLLALGFTEEEEPEAPQPAGAPPPPKAAPPPPPPTSTLAPAPAPRGLSLAQQLAAKKSGMAHVELSEPEPELHPMAGQDEVPFDQQISEEAFQDLQLKANLEYWIEPLKEITFDTALAPISVADANLLIRCYEHYEQGAGKDGAELPTADAEALAALEATLAECMASLNAGEGARFFVKDSSRGPKDFGLISDDFVAQFTAAVRAAKATTDDAKLAVMLEVATAELSMGSAAEALPLFVRSQRVNVDMHAWLNHHDKVSPTLRRNVRLPAAKTQAPRFAPQHPMNWVVRTWRPIDVDLEFRCFVFGGKINAISQYNHSKRPGSLQRRWPSLREAGVQTASSSGSWTGRRSSSR